MSSPAERLQAYLALHIPLSTAMQVRVESFDGEALVLSAPLAVNHNDKGTAFAGSIASLAALAGWGACMLWAESQLGACQVAIAHADIRYLQPLRGDLRARAELPPPEVRAETLHRIHDKGRGRLRLTITLSDPQGTAAIQHADYAIWRV